MQPPTGFPSFTTTWHNDTYPAISPNNAALSAAGKTVIVTGGGRGLGSEMARAFAEAGAAHVALMGRNENNLLTTKDALERDFPKTKATTHAADVADEQAVGNAATDVGPWDILVLNAGVAPKPAMIGETDIEGWWKGFETNVKGPLLLCQALLPTHRANSAIIGITAGSLQLPPASPFNRGRSAYNASKIAQLKLLENLASENPDIFVASVHPGIIMTDMAEGADASGLDVPLDDIKLPAHFLLWLTSPEAKFLHGRSVWANWDVEELKAKAKEVEASPFLLTSNILGWPYQP